MKYLKFFEAQKKEKISDQSPREMAELIFKYFKEFEEGKWSEVNIFTYGDFGSVLRNNYDGDLEYDDSPMTIDEISSSIENIYRDGRDLSYFKEYYEEIIEVSKSVIDMEEIDDLFLSCEYKYTIFRLDNSYTPEFKIFIKLVKESDVNSLISNIWGVIGKRLPDKYFIRGINIGRKRIGESVNIQIFICGPDYYS